MVWCCSVQALDLRSSFCSQLPCIQVQPRANVCEQVVHALCLHYQAEILVPL